MKLSQKNVVFWSIALVITVADYISKRMIEGALERGQSVEVIGDFLRFTLGYNTGIAFGISLGDSSRVFLVIVTLLTMGLIVWLFRSVDPRHKAQIIAFGLIMGGAIGNLLDRVFGSQGVVDFIDVGIGANRFWTFNIADSGITVGAILLILSSIFDKDAQRAPAA
jgi:signal peptidase II